MKRVSVPKNLLGAIWIQFEEAVTDNKKFEKCACKKWFEVSGKAARSDKKHCSATCRTKAHRNNYKNV